VPHRERPVVLYCASGNRSAYAAKTLGELGYTDVVSLAGGFSRWKQNGREWRLPRALDKEQFERYSRHVLIPEVGEEGQLRLLDSKVLLIGAGGLGSPAALYLAAAGVGTIGVIDADVVDRSNLQRQIVHTEDRIGMPKVDSAEIAMKGINPDVKIVKYTERLDSSNVLDVIAGYDVIVDGTDNFPTRYLLNDASLVAGIPVVHGSIYQFEGSVTVYKPFEGPCYRCQDPEPPPPELAPSCAEGGVLGVLPGIMGALQAAEAIKLVLGIGETMVGRLMLFDALDTTFHEVSLRRDPDCPVCGEHAGPIEYIDYEAFCLPPARALA
jgi:molybdopterin/thiamine biosynthesis adenylyltransferase